MTETVALNRVQAEAARAVTNGARDLRRHLEQVKDSVEHALALMDDGKSVPGSYGPLGTQQPMDVAAAAILLDAAVRHAMAVGVPGDVIDHAYRIR